MAKRLLYYSLVVLLFSCGSSRKSTLKSDYFEGVITFDVTYKAKASRYDDQQLGEVLGSKLVMSMKDGNTRKDYYAPNGKLVTSTLFSIKDHRSYSMRNALDSILTYDPSVSDFDCVVTQQGKAEHLGHSCKIIVVEGTSKPHLAFPYTIKTTYYISPQLPLNPSWYANFKDGSFNEVTQMGKGYYLKSIVESPTFDKFTTATKIEQKSLDAKLFVRDLSRPLKEI